MTAINQRAIVKGTLASLVQTRNIFTARVDAVGGDTPALLWDVYLDSIYDSVKLFTVNIWSSYSVEIQDQSGTQWVTSDENAFAKTGTLGTDSLPNAVAVVLLGKASGLRHIGRKFFSGISEGATVVNVLVGDAVTNAAAALLAYITPVTGVGGGTLTPGVTDATGTFHPFVGGVVSSLLGSMRRRKPGIGI